MKSVGDCYCSMKKSLQIPTARETTLVFLLLLSVASAQKGTFRPYNPIQNIFETIFRGPPGSAPNAPPPPPAARRAPPQQQQPTTVPPSSGAGGNLPRPTSPLTAPNAAAAAAAAATAPKSPAPQQQQPRSLNGQQQQQRQQQQQQQPPSGPGGNRPPQQSRPRPNPGGGGGNPRGNNVAASGGGSARIILRPLTAGGGQGPQQQQQQQQQQQPTGPEPVAPAQQQQQQEFSGSQPLAPVVTSTPPVSSSTSDVPETTPVAVIDELNRAVPTLTEGARQPVGGILIRPVGQETAAKATLEADLPFIAPLDVVVDNDVGGVKKQQRESFTSTEAGKPLLPSSQQPSPLVTLSPEFRVKPRGNSGPVLFNKAAPLEKSPQPAGNQIEASTNNFTASEELTESDGFYFAKANAEQLPPPAALVSHKTARQLDPADHPQLLQESHGHGHHQHHPEDTNVISKRFDEVRELVDCGGNDLGFCDMSSKYPGHMMGDIMSDCQELVYKGFVPVPDDLDELGEDGPLTKYTNSSKSSVRAQQGTWSWKPYSYKKKQICESELRFIRPGYARDATGKWQVIVQTEALPQRVAIDLCHNPEKPCFQMSDCGRKSRCVQRYNFQHLLAVDPDNLHNCPTIRAFKFPSACVCHIELSDHY